MPAQDNYHDVVKTALIKDGWRITADPYTIRYGGVQLFADLLADRTLELERNGQQIIVEVKSFIGRSAMRDFETALGQYIIYRTLLKVVLPDAQVYLAINRGIYESFFQKPAVLMVLAEVKLALIIIDLIRECNG